MGKLFAVTLALSAFLLFTVQPMVARMMLPYLGGSAVVWNTSMVFFQAMLVAGYLWAHYSLRWFGVRKTRFTHIALLLVGCAVFPIAIEPAAEASQRPIMWLLGQLALTTALPFFAIAASAPLLQRWYASSEDDDPYWLYAASNVGSFAALLAYPLLIEPLLGVRAQSWAWGAAYLALIAVTALAARSTRPGETKHEAVESASWGERAHWLGLSAIPAALLIAVTTTISTDLASVPLLWVIPLGLYLLSFVIVFARRQFVSVPQAQTFVVVFAAPIVAMLAFDISKPIWALVAMHLAAFMAMCLLYHGELARLRPAPEKLTDFYLWMSIGGVVGGSIVSIVAPALLNDRWEYPILFGVALLWLGRRKLPWDGRWWLVGAGALAGLATAAIFVAGGRVTVDSFDMIIATFFVSMAGMSAGVARMPRYGMPALVGIGVVATVMVASAQNVIERRRSHFASYWVGQKTTDVGDFNVLYHGHVRHGAQSTDPALRDIPLSYYHPEGPAGDVMNAIRERKDTRPIGIVGLGVGALATYTQPGQTMTFFEIDPVIAELARDPDYFSYLALCPGECPVKIGDGRVLLEAEPDGHFQLLVLDAYNSDAIPTHLLTVEAMDLYMKKLAPDGVLLLHVSNTFLDVATVAENVAAAGGYAVSRKSWWPRERRLYDLQVNRADYIAVARNHTILNGILGPRWKKKAGDSTGVIWTDDYANIVSIYTWE